MNIKTIIISAVVIATAALTAQAQGLGTVRDINSYGEEYLLEMRAKEAMKRVQKEAEKQRMARIRAEQEKAAKAKQQKAENKSATAQTTDANAMPSYYYGREGKVLALSDRTAEALKGSSKDAKPAEAKPAAKQEAPKKASKKKGCFLKYLLPVGRFPGESWEDWNARMSSAASQPFK